MRDERRIIVVEEDGKTGEGWGKMFGTIFPVVVALALVDRGLTLAWQYVGWLLN